jgi:hypothetical protein
MLLAALVVLNALCLIGGLLLNAELLNLAGADIPIKRLHSLEIYGQILAAVSVCLFAWRLCIWGHRRFGHTRYLYLSIALSTALAAPLTWWFQAAVPDLIADKFPTTLRVYSLYAYVAKKGLLYDSLQIPNLPYKEYRDKGEGKAFIANLGVLMSVQSSYVEQIDRNFQGFAVAVFRGYTRRNADSFYERLQAEVVPGTEAIIRAYAQVEALRATGVPGYQWVPIRWNADGQGLEPQPSIEEYARSIKPGIRSREAIANSDEIRDMARHALGPLYVKGMDVFASRTAFDAYLPGIANNMAYDVAHTDIRGEEGVNVLKNMWFVPWSLLSGLFMGALNIVGMALAIVERRGLLLKGRRVARTIAIVAILVIPLMAGNAILQSSGYKTAFRSVERGPMSMAAVFHWAMSAEAMLYNLTKPLLKTE